MKGLLVTVEGVEGSGKTTQASRLADALRGDRREVVLTREPGGTELGRVLRRMLLDDFSPEPTPETELLLYLADRAEHVRRLIRPALERGAVVITDRFSDSTIAYQVYGRGLPREAVRAIDEFARGGITPTLTLLLDLPPEEGLARAGAVSPADRFEREALDFHRRVREGFHEIALGDPGRILVLDARLPVEELARRIAERARARLAELR